MKRCISCRHCTPEKICALQFKIYGDIVNVRWRLSCEFYEEKEKRTEP